MKNILITGGAGFIGSNLALLLIECGYNIKIIDNLNKKIHGSDPKLNSETYNLIKNDVEFIFGSITSKKDMLNALADVDIIIHLASETGTGESMYEISNYNYINSQGTALLMDLLINNKNNVSKFILTSSRSVYGEGAYDCINCARVFPKARSIKDFNLAKWNPSCPICNGEIISVPTEENAQVSPSSIYAATKLAQEDLIKIACSSISIDYTILRLQNVYGAGQSLSNPYTGILSIFSNLIKQGLEIPIFEDGLESRDFIYVSDVVEAIKLSIEQKESNAKTINIGSGVPSPIMQVANLLVKNLDGQIKPQVTGEFRLGDIRHCYADISFASSILGFEPKIDLKSGIAKFSKWVKLQDSYENKLYEANQELESRGFMKKI